MNDKQNTTLSVAAGVLIAAGVIFAAMLLSCGGCMIYLRATAPTEEERRATAERIDAELQEQLKDFWGELPSED